MKIEKEFIPYEQALALKELGFNEPCMMNHYGNKRLHIGRLYLPSSFGKGKNSEMYDDSLRDGDVTAVLYQQSFRWFREKYKLEASIQRMPPEVYGKGKGGIKNYLLYIWAENLNPRGQQTLHFDTYEEAELECLKKLIEIVKDGKK